MFSKTLILTIPISLTLDKESFQAIRAHVTCLSIRAESNLRSQIQISIHISNIKTPYRNTPSQSLWGGIVSPRPVVFLWLVIMPTAEPGIGTIMKGLNVPRASYGQECQRS